MTPLQTAYLTEGDPVLAALLFGILGAGIFVLVVVNILRGGISTGLGKGEGKHAFHAFAHRRAAAAFGLNRVQTTFLEEIFRKASVGDTTQVLMDSNLLDKHLHRAFKDIDSSATSDADAEQRKALLFSIRTMVESVTSMDGKISGTHQIGDNQPIVLTTATGAQYPLKVLSAKGETLLVEAPLNAMGTPVSLGRGAKVTVAFYSKTNIGYRLQTKVLGTQSTPSGNALSIAHSRQVSSLPNRKNKRREAKFSCYFAPAKIRSRKEGKRVIKDVSLTGGQLLGTIVDISAGGCAIKSASPLKAGDFLKIEFDDTHGHSHGLFGRIVRTNKAGAFGGVMHIQFIKATRRAINAINAYVYAYDEP